MKGKILSVLLLVFISAALLVSCDGDSGPQNYDEYIFSSETIPEIIYDSKVDISSVNAVYRALRDATGEIPFYGDDKGDAVEHEIVIGNTSRAISKKALRKLRTIERVNEYSSAYLIYASGGSVAIVFDDDVDHLGETAVIEYFVNNYVIGKSELKLGNGVVYASEINAIDYYEAIDAANQAEKWAALEAEILKITGDESDAKAFSAALKSFYEETYDVGIVSWLANLYEPFNCFCGECVPGEGVACYGGGFYYSNSARDNEGYYPDIESTAQAVGMLTGLGLGSGGYKNILSDDAKAQILQFLRECQHENGFFYHPQWSKEDTDAHTSRRARDTSNAASVIVELGGTPKYKTPTGVSGESGVNLTTPLGNSVAFAASKVVLSAGYATHLEDLETYKAYLDGLRASGTNFYAIGNTISSQMTQIKQRDIDLKTINTDRSLVKYTIEWFTKHQNAETGTWETTANQLAINGLLKISGVFNSAGVALPHADKAIESILSLMYNNEKTPPVTVFNIWQSAKNVLSNVTNYGASSGIDVAAIRKQLIKDAPAAIAASSAKLQESLRVDGSFAYNYNTSSSTSQGMPVAIPGAIEGDVNATMLAMTGTYGGMFATFGISVYPKPFGYKEGRIFRQILDELGPVQKIGVIEDNATALDFEDDAIGETPTSLNPNFKSNGASVTVTEEGKTGNGVRLISKAGGGDYLYIPNTGVKTGKSFVFEGNFKINSDGTRKSGYILQVHVGNSYMFGVDAVADGTVKIYEATTTASATDITNDIAIVNKDEWFKLRFEFYCGDASGARIKCYVNDELKVISNNYYGKLENATTVPATTSLQNSFIYCMSSMNISMDLDDLFCYASSKTFVGATDADTGVIYDVDRGGAITPPDSGSGEGGTDTPGTDTPGTDTPVTPPVTPPVVETGKLTFDNDAIGSTPSSITTEDNSGGAIFTVVEKTPGDNALKFVSVSGGGDKITFNNAGSAEGSCYVFEAKIKVDSSSSKGLIYRLWLGTSYYFCIRNSADGASLEECTTDADATAIKNPIALLAHDEWYDIRIEYYKGDASTVRVKCYVNGDLLVVSDNYFGKTTDPSTTKPPVTAGCWTAKIFTLNKASCTMYLDDLCVSVTNDTYTPATAEDTKVVYNVDAK